MKQRGIALIQVLLLSTILTVLLLSMHHQARQHLKLAQAVRDYTHATMALQSAEAEILFTMLSTQPALMSRTAGLENWNFHGRPFEFNGVHLNVQDTSGLLNASSPPTQLLTRFTERHNGSAALGRQIADTLADWQDKDDSAKLDGAEQADYAEGFIRNAPIQYIEEWLFVKGVTPDVFQAIRPLLTLFPQGVNLNQQPDALWQLRLPATAYDELRQARDSGALNIQLYQTVTGHTPDEFDRFSTGPGYRISFTVQNGDVRLARELTLRLMPFQQQPYDIYEYRLRNLPTDNLNAAPDYE
jgi:general secretion pathway protein K